MLNKVWRKVRSPYSPAYCAIPDVPEETRWSLADDRHPEVPRVYAATQREMWEKLRRAKAALGLPDDSAEWEGPYPADDPDGRYFPD